MDVTHVLRSAECAPQGDPSPLRPRRERSHSLGIRGFEGLHAQGETGWTLSAGAAQHLSRSPQAGARPATVI